MIVTADWDHDRNTTFILPHSLTHPLTGSPEDGMVVCKIGGPAYRIGMGGGAASSRCVAILNSVISLS